MKSKTPKVVLPLVMLVAFTAVSRAVVVNFGETVPTGNIVTSYDPVSQGTLGWLRTPDTNRIVAETFTTPGGTSYLMDAITMKLYFTLQQNYAAPMDFTIDFYQLSAPGQNPETGSYLSTQSGSMQPNQSTATAGSYFSFELDTPVTLQAGVSYGYVLAFTTAAEYNVLHPAISDGAPQPNGNIAWLRTNGGSWGTADGQTYAYYIQGTAIPEPGTVALIGLAAGGFLLMRRRSAKQA